MLAEKSRISDQGIATEALSEEEFSLLPYLDSQLYIDSALARFEEWKSSFDYEHPDWQDRIMVQRQLADCFGESCDKGAFSIPQNSKAKVLFLGASLGSIATLFFSIEWLKRFDQSELELHILDLIEEPLVRTRAGDFSLPAQAMADCDPSGTVTESDYKNILKNSVVHVSNVIELSNDLPDYDLVIAPYLHHHLNIFDKAKACREMDRISKPGTLQMIGDLYFDYESFNRWLVRHCVEEVPYAIESFITNKKHQSFFKQSELVCEKITDISYAFSLLKK